ncbi:MAG TPA: helix-turn-helix domain-containing protein [Acidimicrobiales bacterium]|nr:helix-turn-helix domain-containing protein [Acidimicrobiales bacterium]
MARKRGLSTVAGGAPDTMARSRGATGATAATPDEVRRSFEAFGLNGYQARVLLALLQCGSSTAPELAQLADVPRTSVYAALQDLAAHGLAESLPGRLSLWVSPGSGEVLQRLYAMQEQRLGALRTTMEQTQAMLDQLVAEPPALPLTDVHLVRGEATAKTIYDRLLSQAESEVLIFNRPPYSWAHGQRNQAVLDLLARGVPTRALYEQQPFEAGEADAFRSEDEAYMAAGVKARLVAGELPFKLAVFDRKVALVGTSETGQRVYPTLLLIEHAAYAAAHAVIFEHHWAEATPYVPSNDVVP